MATRSSDFRRGTLAGMGVIFAAQALYWFLSGGPTTATAARAWRSWVRQSSGWSPRDGLDAAARRRLGLTGTVPADAPERACARISRVEWRLLRRLVAAGALRARSRRSSAGAPGSTRGLASPVRRADSSVGARGQRAMSTGRPTVGHDAAAGPPSPSRSPSRRR